MKTSTSIKTGQKLAMRHGAAANGHRTRAYSVWISIRARCKNVKDPWYGKMGITVCERWQSFESFLADMGEPPSARHQIDRIDPSGHYEPRNCRWVTPSENALNRRQTRWIEFGGERKSLWQWARHLDINPRTLKARIDRGWPLERAFCP